MPTIKSTVTVGYLHIELRLDTRSDNWGQVTNSDLV